MYKPLLKTKKQTNKISRGPSLVLSLRGVVFDPCSGKMPLLIHSYKGFKLGAATLCLTQNLQHCIPLGNGFAIYKSFNKTIWSGACAHK